MRAAAGRLPESRKEGTGRPPGRPRKKAPPGSEVEPFPGPPARVKAEPLLAAPLSGPPARVKAEPLLAAPLPSPPARVKAEPLLAAPLPGPPAKVKDEPPPAVRPKEIPAADAKKIVAPDFARWVYQTYEDQLQLGSAEGGRAYHEFMNSMDFSTFPLSGATRVQNFHIMKYGYPMRRAGYMTAVFVVRAFDGDARTGLQETYYAYAYWPQVKGEAVSGDPEYVCVSPTFESRDGEYRHRFVWYPQFAEGYNNLANELSPLEECLLDAIRDDDIGLDVYAYPRGGHYYGKSLEDDRLALRLLVAALALDADVKEGGHTLSVYVEVIRRIKARCAATVDALGNRTVRLSRFSAFATGAPNRPLRTQCGQKIVPLTVRESLNVDDVNYAPWREVWASRRATDLIVNRVSPNVPIFGNWTYLSGADSSLFENGPMRERYELSLRAEGVVRSLRDARDLAEIGGAAANYRMGQIDARVLEAIEYAQGFAVLTDLALCSTSEYVGVTFRALPHALSAATPEIARFYHDPTLQARYLFDLCYGAHMLHTRLAIVHTDLHLGNITMHRQGSQYDANNKAKYANPVIAYIAGERGEADTYVFPHDGWFATLIDFSRAIIGPGAQAELAAEESEAFAAGFYRDQASRVLRAFQHYLPIFTETHQDKIKGAIYADYDGVFRALTAVDFLAIGRNVGAFYAEAAATKKVASEGRALAARIEEQALAHLTTALSDIVSGGRGGARRPYAGEAILPGAFDEYRYAAWAAGEIPPAAGYSLEEATLVDAYNGGGPLRYSGSDYDRFPPWARFDEMERHLGGAKMANLTADRGTRPFLESRRLDGYLAAFQEKVRRAQAGDRGAAATSSWLAE